MIERIAAETIRLVRHQLDPAILWSTSDGRHIRGGRGAVVRTKPQS